MSNRMTTEMMLDASLKTERLTNIIDMCKTAQQLAELRERVKVFEAVVWFPLLQAKINGTDSRGMSAFHRGTAIKTWCCAGRCLIQFDRAEDHITLITADDEKPWNRDMCHVAPNMGPMGIQSIDADPYEAMKMIYEATRYCNEINLVPDADVTIG